LALSDYLWSITFILRYSVLLYDPYLSNKAMCITFRAIYQIFGGATIFWTACVALYVYVSIFQEPQWLKNHTNMWRFFHIWSWGVPTVFFLCTLAIPDSLKYTLIDNQNQYCLNAEPKALYNIIFWITPNFLTYVFTAVVYFIFLRKLQGILLRNRTPIPQKVTLYLLVYLICWIGDMVVRIWHVITGCVPFFLHWIGVLLLPTLMGFFDALVYWFTRSEIRNQIVQNGVFTFVLSVVLSPLTLLFIVPCIFVRNCYRIESEDDSMENLGVISPLLRSSSGNLSQDISKIGIMSK